MAKEIIDTRDCEVGQADIVLTMDEMEWLKDHRKQVASVDSVAQKKKLDDLKFMQDEMVIMLHESTDPHAVNPVDVSVNGVTARFFRGQPTRTKRMFVNGLIVKKTTFTTPEMLNGAGERTYGIKSMHAHEYPFSVIEDKNRKGPAWLQSRLAQVE